MNTTYSNRIILSFLLFFCSNLCSFSQEQYAMIGKSSFHFIDNKEELTDRFLENFNKEQEKLKLAGDSDKVVEGRGLIKFAFKITSGAILKKLRNTRFVTSMPEGEHYIYAYYDVTNNRQCQFIPSIGRISVVDFDNRTTFVAFPNLKIAWIGVPKFTVPPATKKDSIKASKNDADIAVYLNPNVKTMLESKTIPNSAKVEEFNGFKSIENFEYANIDNGSEPIDTVVIDGETKGMYPLPGHLLLKNDKEFFTRWLIDAEQHFPYFDATSYTEFFQPCSINEQNFILPNGYKTYTDIKKVNELAEKAQKENLLSMPIPEKMPDVFWP